MQVPLEDDGLNEFKLLLLGDTTVGKSSILLRFVDDRFHETFAPTIGVDFRYHSIKLEEKLINLQIWDSTGQESLRSITRSYYKGAQGIILVYDLSNIHTFYHLQGI